MRALRRAAARWLSVAALAVAAGAWLLRPEPPPQPAAGGVSLEALFGDLEPRSGDLVFRRGRSLVSRSVLAVDRGSPFSHVGLVSVEAGRKWVIHALPPESEDDVGQVLEEPLHSFLASHRARAAAVYRLAGGRPETGRRAALAARRYVEEAVPFDRNLDSSDASALYCTEMVWTAYREAGVDLVEGNFFVVRTPFEHVAYVLPSTLLRSRHLRRLGGNETSSPAALLTPKLDPHPRLAGQNQAGEARHAVELPHLGDGR